jgi:hypothetical protein
VTCRGPQQQRNRARNSNRARNMSGWGCRAFVRRAEARACEVWEPKAAWDRAAKGAEQRAACTKRLRTRPDHLQQSIQYCHAYGQNTARRGEPSKPGSLVRVSLARCLARCLAKRSPRHQPCSTMLRGTCQGPAPPRPSRRGAGAAGPAPLGTAAAARARARARVSMPQPVRGAGRVPEGVGVVDDEGARLQLPLQLRLQAGPSRHVAPGVTWAFQHAAHQCTQASRGHS